MPRPFSVSDTQRIAPADFHRWAMRGALLAATAYSLISVLGLWPAGEPGAVPVWSQVVAALICWISVGLVARGRARVGVVLTIAAVWVEVHVTFFLVGRIPSPGLLAGPVIVTAVGLMFGSRAALYVAVLDVASTGPLMALGAPGSAVSISPLEGYWLALHAIITFAAWGLIALSLDALSRVLREVQDKEQELSDLIASAPDGIIVVGLDDRVQAANPAAVRLLGLSEGACAGRALRDVLADAGSEASVATLQLTDATEAPVAWTLRRAGQPPVHLEVTWRSAAARRRQLMLRDVSERVRADEARRAVEGQLAHAQRLEAVGQLAGGIAHDFNNLLLSIGGSVELLRREGDPEQRAALLDEVAGAQERGATLTRQLLAFARREVTKPTVFDVSAQLGQLQRLLQRVAGERVRLSCDLEPACCVRADIGQLEQVLLNLVANARDAMPTGGACAVSVTRARQANGAEVVHLRVADEGVGMDAATQARAFEPFFTTKPRGRGTGLGLASVHGMVMQSGGEVSLTSAPGAGTTVTLTFPLVDAPISVVTADAVRELPMTPSVATVLVADDDDSTRAIVARILRRAGHHVLLAPDGLQALRRLEEVPRGGVQLVIADVMMPGLTGPQLAATVRDRWPKLPILFMSGYPEDALGDTPDLPLDHDFIGKPFAGHELLHRVAVLLAEARSRGNAA